VNVRFVLNLGTILASLDLQLHSGVVFAVFPVDGQNGNPFLINVHVTERVKFEHFDL